MKEGCSRTGAPGIMGKPGPGPEGPSDMQVSRAESTISLGSLFSSLFNFLQTVRLVFCSCVCPDTPTGPLSQARVYHGGLYVAHKSLIWRGNRAENEDVGSWLQVSWLRASSLQDPWHLFLTNDRHTLWHLALPVTNHPPGSRPESSPVQLPHYGDLVSHYEILIWPVLRMFLALFSSNALLENHP